MNLLCKLQLALGAFADYMQVVKAPQHKAQGPRNMDGCTVAVRLLLGARQVLQKLALMGVDQHLQSHIGSQHGGVPALAQGTYDAATAADACGLSSANMSCWQVWRIMMAYGALAAVYFMHLHALDSSWPCRVCISQPSMLQACVLVMTLMSMPVSDPDFCRGQS